MRLSKRKIVAWLVATILSFNPLLGTFAIETHATDTTDCQVLMPAVDDVGDHMINCTQYHACASYCQFTPLQPTGLSQTRISWRSLPIVPSKPANLTTRYIDSIERPPRV